MIQDISTVQNTTISSNVSRMFGFSLHGWENVMVASLGLAAVFAAIVGIATYCVVQLQRQEISASKDEFERYKLDAGRAVSEANARAAEAQLALEQFKTPRSLSVTQAQDVSAKMSKWAMLPKSGETQSAAVFSVSDTFESKTLADQIAAALGHQGAKWSINRYPVMYGRSFSVSGVAMFIPKSNSRAFEVAADLVSALNANGIAAFIAPERRDGCEEVKGQEGQGETNPWCSAISVMVGEKPR